jgi:putative PIN family toxin of toxin-antitoxin system
MRYDVPVRIVLDTSVVVSGVRSASGASRSLLELALNGSFEVLVSNALVTEYEAVLTRPEQLQASRLTVNEIREFLDALCRVAMLVAIHQQWRPLLKDPDDEMVLEAAINGHADAIVTFNQSHFLPATPRHGISVLFPREALERVNAI